MSQWECQALGLIPKEWHLDYSSYINIEEQVKSKAKKLWLELPDVKEGPHIVGLGEYGSFQPFDAIPESYEITPATPPTNVLSILPESLNFDVVIEQWQYYLKQTNFGMTGAMKGYQGKSLDSLTRGYAAAHASLPRETGELSGVPPELMILVLSHATDAAAIKKLQDLLMQGHTQEIDLGQFVEFLQNNKDLQVSLERVAAHVLKKHLPTFPVTEEDNLGPDSPWDEKPRQRLGKKLLVCPVVLAEGTAMSKFLAELRIRLTSYSASSFREKIRRLEASLKEITPYIQSPHPADSKVDVFLLAAASILINGRSLTDSATDAADILNTIYASVVKE